MGADLDRPAWKGQRPWFEIWFAVLLDETRRRALWIRQTLFVPRQGDGRATIWGAWFDADATAADAGAAKRFAPLDERQARRGRRADPDRATAYMSRSAAVGAVEGLAWDVAWARRQRRARRACRRWLPAPTHARRLVHDAEADGHA